jgi:hypothetical protein
MRTAAVKQDLAAGQEAVLHDYAQRLVRHAQGRRAVHVHLSRLQPYNRRDHHLRIAASAFDNLLKRFDGQFFRLGNGDLVCVVRGATVAEIDDVVLKLRFLFSDDPLTHDDDTPGGPGFCSWYDLARDYADFRAMAEHMVRLAEIRAREQMEALERGDSAEDAEANLAPLDPARLARLEQAVANMDLRPLIRRQPICAILPNMPPKVVLNELYVSIGDLRRKVMPDVDLAADRWLFQRFSQTLDLNLLGLLPTLEQGVVTAASININVSTLLSTQFLAFDAKFRALTHKTVVFELQPVDVFGDISSFVFARDFVRERGYRVCLDGLNHLTFPLLQRGQLGCDLEKIVWAMDMEHDASAERRERLRQAMAEAGPSRVILCRCDSPRAIAFGHQLGITLFQGRHVDRLMTGAAAPGRGTGL